MLRLQVVCTPLEVVVKVKYTIVGRWIILPKPDFDDSPQLASDLYFDGLDDFNPVEEEQTCHGDSLSEALQTINPSWPFVVWHFVHPAHREEVCNLWQTQLKKSGQEESVYPHKRQRWMELFGNRMSNALQNTRSDRPPVFRATGGPDGSLFDTKARQPDGQPWCPKKETLQHARRISCLIHCVTTAPLTSRNYQPRDVKYTKLFFTDEATALSAGHRPWVPPSPQTNILQAWFDFEPNAVCGSSLQHWTRWIVFFTPSA